MQCTPTNEVIYNDNRFSTKSSYGQNKPLVVIGITKIVTLQEHIHFQCFVVLIAGTKTELVNKITHSYVRLMMIRGINIHVVAPSGKRRN